MQDMLIAAVVDFSGSGWIQSVRHRIVGSIGLGVGGEIRQAETGNSFLVARRGGMEKSGGDARARPTRIAPSTDGAFTILAGRLFEREELLRKLGIDSPRFDDAGLYRAAYERFGNGVDNQIVGDYAVIQWSPDERQLRVARSPTSAQPLHVWRSGPRLVISSIPRLILAAGADAEIDDDALADILLLNFMDQTSSLYRGMDRVAAGTWEIHNQDGAKRLRYWSIGDCPPVRFSRDDDYVEALDEVMRRAVKTELQNARKPSIMLSGGLDSQAVAAYAVGALGRGQTLRSYTSIPMAGWTPDGRSNQLVNEQAHVEELVKMHPQVEPVFLSADDEHFGDRADAMYLLGGMPTHNEMTMHASHAIMSRARDDGCDVLLHGAFGNISFSYAGHTGIRTWFRQGKWVRMFHEMRMGKDERSLARQIFARLLWPHMPRSIRLWRDRDNPKRPDPFASWSPLREDFARASGSIERAVAAGSDPRYFPTPDAASWRELVTPVSTGLASDLWLGLRLMYGVEPRDPLAFSPLVEFCAGVPDEQYLRDGESRWLARRLLKGKVPEMVRTEKRNGMAAADWPMRFARDRENMLAAIEGMKSDQRLARIFDFERLSKDLQQWDGRDQKDNVALARIYLAVGRGLSTARFVQYVEGRNIG